MYETDPVNYTHTHTKSVITVHERTVARKIPVSGAYIKIKV